MLIDTHAHLYLEEFKNDLSDVIKRAQDAGLKYIVCPGIDLETSKKSIELAERFDMVFACVGFHPHDASKADEKALKEIEKISSHPKVVAIGEVGLDYHYNFSPPEKQREIFIKQIDIAQRRNLPIIVHSRKSEHDVLKIIEDKINSDSTWRKFETHKNGRFPPPRGVFHCFPGDIAMARKVINMGFYISIPGPITYGNKPGRPNMLEQVAEKVSPEHILLETDSPYLAPQPHRGKRNEPSYLPLINKKIAELHGLYEDDIARTNLVAVYKLFGIGEYPKPVFAYKIRNSLYLNITLRCNADCWFCDRKGEALVKGYNLRIENEPTISEIIDAVGDPLRYDEIVFCGFGEPTIRLDVVKEVAKWVKQKGGITRLNTDGHGNIINHRNIVPELVGIIDSISISLNSANPNQYGELMRIDDRKFFNAMVEFSKECVKYKFDVTMTIVDLDEVDKEEARRFVEKEIGAKFKNRPFF